MVFSEVSFFGGDAWFGNFWGLLRTWVCEPDVSIGVNEEIINSVEITAEIVVQDSGRFVCCRVERPQPWSLLHSTNAVVSSRCAPVNEAVVKCSAIRRIDGWIGEILGKCWGVTIEIYDQLG